MIHGTDGDKNTFVFRGKFQRVGNQIVKNLVGREKIRQCDDRFDGKIRQDFYFLLASGFLL